MNIGRFVAGFVMGFLPLLALNHAFAQKAKTPAGGSAGENVPPSGFTALFNGKDLTGWVEQGKTPTNWTAENGILTFNGKGADLQGTQKFSNFILLIDWKSPKKGNSGIYLRGGATQVEINDDDSQSQPPSNATSGGLYPDKAPIKRAAKPAEEWNHYEIRVEKGVITVFLNGEKTIDVYAKQWGEATTGTLGFQSHGTPIYYKNIYIKKLAD